MDSNNMTPGMPPPPPVSERSVPPPPPFEPEFSVSPPPAPSEAEAAAYPQGFDAEPTPAEPSRKERTLAFLKSTSATLTQKFSHYGSKAKSQIGILRGQTAAVLTRQFERVKTVKASDFRSVGVRVMAAIRSIPARIRGVQLPKDRREFLVWIEKIQAQFNAIIQRRKAKPQLGRHAKFLTLILCAFFLSDLVVILLEKWLPEVQAPRAPIADVLPPPPPSIASYEPIWSRNLFSSRGLLPGEGDLGMPNMDAAPIRTALPLALIGTIMMQDPRLSIATLEDKANGRQVYPVRVEDEVPGMFRVLEVEARKVVFLNLQTNRKEFVDLPEDDSASQSPVVFASPGSSGIQQKSMNHFVMSRAEIDAQMANISQVLTQARAIPHFENGVPVGLRLIQIVPGSLYDKAGIKNEDVLKAVDGEPVANDPTKGMELLTKLKTAKGLEITVNRGGRDVTISYDIQN